MGDCQNEDLRVQFDRRLKPKFLGSKVTTDAGLLAYRELDEAFALREMVQDTLEDSRIGSNLKKLMDLSGDRIDKVHQRKPPKRLILGMDSSVSQTYGQQEGSAYNGHFGCTCYHPLFLLNQFGDLERPMLRRGNHASAKFWRDCHITTEMIRREWRRVTLLSPQDPTAIPARVHRSCYVSTKCEQTLR